MEKRKTNKETKVSLIKRIQDLEKRVDWISREVSEDAGDIERCWRAVGRICDRIEELEQRKPDFITGTTVVGSANIDTSQDKEYAADDYVEYYYYENNQWVKKRGIIDHIIHTTRGDVVVFANQDMCSSKNIIGYVTSDKKEPQQPKYKIGDYVHYVGNDTIFRDGKIEDYKDGLFLIGEYWVEEAQIKSYAEPKPDLLTPEEKEYLSAVIKPFRNIIESITKYSDPSRDHEFISINYCDGNWFTLPCFSTNKYYKNFEKDHSYTLKELGL